MNSPAGYSRTPLVQKLGIKTGQRVWIIHPPAGYLGGILDPLPEIELVLENPAGLFDVIQIFTKDRSDLSARFPELKAALQQKGALWVSWPKRASGVKTDLTETIIREIGLEGGLVDVKVAAVDATWSGLKFVYRVKDRQK